MGRHRQPPVENDGRIYVSGTATNLWRISPEAALQLLSANKIPPPGKIGKHQMVVEPDANYVDLTGIYL
jgi:hypothetical protein